eukprot:4951047-Amphidinium_carterae.1
MQRLRMELQERERRGAEVRQGATKYAPPKSISNKQKTTRQAECPRLLYLLALRRNMARVGNPGYRLYIATTLSSTGGGDRRGRRSGHGDDHGDDGDDDDDDDKKKKKKKKHNDHDLDSNSSSNPKKKKGGCAGSLFCSLACQGGCEHCGGTWGHLQSRCHRNMVPGEHLSREASQENESSAKRKRETIKLTGEVDENAVEGRRAIADSLNLNTPSENLATSVEVQDGKKRKGKAQAAAKPKPKPTAKAKNPLLAEVTQQWDDFYLK